MIEELTEKLATLDKDKVYKLSHACIVFNKITRRWWVHENDYGKYHTSYSIGAIPLLAGINFYIESSSLFTVYELPLEEFEIELMLRELNK